MYDCDLVRVTPRLKHKFFKQYLDYGLVKMVKKITDRLYAPAKKLFEEEQEEAGGFVTQDMFRRAVYAINEGISKANAALLVKSINCPAYTGYDANHDVHKLSGTSEAQMKSQSQECGNTEVKLEDFLNWIMRYRAKKHHEEVTGTT